MIYRCRPDITAPFAVSDEMGAAVMNELP